MKHAPEAVLIVVSNPLDEMTALAAKVTGFPATRVLGQAGMLDTARFSYFVAEKLGVPVGSVQTLTLGSHGDTMVPVPSACTVDGKPLASLLAPGRHRRAGGADPQRRRRDRRPAEDRARPTTRRRPPRPGWPARSPRTPARCMPVCAWVDGEYGITGVYLGVEAEIGKAGDPLGGAARPHRRRAGRAARGGRGGPRQAGRRRQPLTAPASPTTQTPPAPASAPRVIDVRSS